MPVHESVLRQAFDQARGRCECRIPGCCHGGRCGAELDYDGYGESWQVLSVDGLITTSTEPRDYFILCSDPKNRAACYEHWTEGLSATP